MAQQSTEGAPWIDEEQDEAQKEQTIARVGDAYAPGIVVDAEIAALVVGVVAGLVEAIWISTLPYGNYALCIMLALLGNYAL